MFDDTLLGVGLYTVPEAARLIHEQARDLRRWVFGYHYKGRDAAQKTSPPLWQSQLAGTGLEGVGFRDLLELRFVAAFRRHKVSLRTIRIAAARARELLNHPHPFSLQRFRTDGRAIFHEAILESGEEELLDLVKQQRAFTQVIKPSLYAGIEFDGNETAIRWHAVPDSKAIVIDPAIVFGKPVLSEFGVRTSTLYDSWLAEGRDKGRTARNFEVSASAVDAAVRFESRLAA